MKHEYPEKFSAVHFGILTNSIGVICSSAIVIGMVIGYSPWDAFPCECIF